MLHAIAVGASFQYRKPSLSAFQCVRRILRVRDRCRLVHIRSAQDASHAQHDVSRGHCRADPPAFAGEGARATRGYNMEHG
jgi:hypothetical protein